MCSIARTNALEMFFSELALGPGPPLLPPKKLRMSEGIAFET